MDIKLEKKPWYIRYRYYLAGGVAFLAFLIYVVTLSLGPSKLRIEQDNHPRHGKPRPAAQYRRPARRLGKAAYHLPRKRN